MLWFFRKFQKRKNYFRRLSAKVSIIKQNLSVGFSQALKPSLVVFVSACRHGVLSAVLEADSCIGSRNQRTAGSKHGKADDQFSISDDVSTKQ